MINDSDELELIEQIRCGDRESFAPLVKKYQTRVRGYCANFLLDRSLADDAAQEIFVKAYCKIALFRGDSKFSTWLYRIMVNHCRDMLREQSRRPSVSWEEFSANDHEPVSSNGSIFDLQMHSVAQLIEDRDMLSKVLSLLPSDYREILILRDGHDLSYEQIALVLACSLDAVKARIRRARSTLLEKAQELLDCDTFLTSAASEFTRGGK